MASITTRQPPLANTTHTSDDAPYHVKKPTNSRKAPPKAAEAPTTRKRPKATDDVDEDDEEEEEEEKKRSRGRPRLDTKDETAADRRRTQIRLAQRAYRHRKDTAITSLEQKVKDLEDANEDMGKEFMNFYDFFLSQGMLEGAPEVARRLNDTTRKFLSLTRKSNEDSSRDSRDAPPSQHVKSDLVPSHRDSKQSSSTSTASPDQGPMSSPPALGGPRIGASPESMTSYSSSLPQSGFPASNFPFEVITLPTPENASFPIYGSPSQFPYLDHSFTPSPMSSLPPPASYSFQERSFGRRLQRSTLEAGLRLVSMPNPPPHRYAAVFGFCLLFEGREAIIQRLTRTLDKTRQETMNVWKYPFTNLGGAGLFFPEQQPSQSMPGLASGSGNYAAGNRGLPEPYKPTQMTGYSMGPFSPEVEAARDDRLDQRMRMMHSGFQGDFYDADEVDIYLRQRGLVIPENADYVEADIDIDSFRNTSELASMGQNTGGQSYLGANPIPISSAENPGLPLNGMDIGGNNMGNAWPKVPQLPTTVVGPSPIMNAHFSTPQMASHHEHLLQSNSTAPDASQFEGWMASFAPAPAFSQRPWNVESAWMKPKVTIDVVRLVTELTASAVCLGRTPAVRPKDVDRAVRIAAGLTEGPPHKLRVGMSERMNYSSQRSELPKVKPRLIIHGGAGNIQRDNYPPDKYDIYRSALLSIVSETNAYMNTPVKGESWKSSPTKPRQLPSSLDVATFAVVRLENNPLFNSGHGAVFTRDGINQLEASVMVSRGYKKRGVGVMGLRRVRNPILLARDMLKHGEEDLEACGYPAAGALAGGIDVPSAQGHTQLYAEAAEKLAQQYGLEMVDPSYFFTQQRWDEHIRALEREKGGKGSATWSATEYLPQGTCGAVALDEDGVICVATSTGGMTNKLTGRIGDTPVVGAGFWAEEWSEDGDPTGKGVWQRMREAITTSGPSVVLSDAVRSSLADCFPTTRLYSPRIPYSWPMDCNTTTRSMGASGTGNGDSFLRTNALRTVAAMARWKPETSAEAVTHVAGPGGQLEKSAGHRWKKTGEGEGGIIGIECAIVRDSSGGVVEVRSDILMDFNCGGMFRAWINGEGNAVMSVWSNGASDELDCECEQTDGAVG
ncbi:hypothetical protein G7046_g3841 [Stylonectria norvegica]|nr:hypothetical protein G7046_g3841 [Stylonectria norvegica]